MQNYNDFCESYLKKDAFTLKQKHIIERLLAANDESDALKLYLCKFDTERGKSYRGKFASEKKHVINYYISLRLTGNEEETFWNELLSYGFRGGSKFNDAGKQRVKNLNATNCVGSILWLSEALPTSDSWLDLSDKLHATEDKNQKKDVILAEIVKEIKSQVTED